jgi:hypothetical protein
MVSKEWLSVTNLSNVNKLVNNFTKQITNRIDLVTYFVNQERGSRKPIRE